MNDTLNGEELTSGHGFGITDNHITMLGLATLVDKPIEEYLVVYFSNPKQGWLDRFLNGASYIFMTPDYIRNSYDKTNV